MAGTGIIPVLLTAVPQMNRIEEEWHQLKTHEIAGRMFEDEYDLAIAVITRDGSTSKQRWTTGTFCLPGYCLHFWSG